MSILATCSCGGQQRLPNSYEGKQVKCLKCGKMVQVGGSGAGLSERRLKVGDMTLVARCEASQVQQADSVLNKVAAQQNIGVGLGDKVKIPFGWSELQLQKRGTEMLVCEADYSRNPWADVREDITVCIKVGWGQLDLIKKFSANPLACSFSQSIQTAAGCLDSDEELLMRRLKKAKGDDSGWFIGPADQEKLALIHERSDYDTILSYQLLALRPSMVYVLMLPLEFKINFRGDTMTSVMDGDDNVIYTA